MREVAESSASELARAIGGRPVTAPPSERASDRRLFSLSLSRPPSPVNGLSTSDMPFGVCRRGRRRRRWRKRRRRQRPMESPRPRRRRSANGRARRSRGQDQRGPIRAIEGEGDGQDDDVNDDVAVVAEALRGHQLRRRRQDVGNRGQSQRRRRRRRSRPAGLDFHTAKKVR